MPERKQRNVLGLSTFLGLLVLICWFLFFGSVSLAIDERIPGWAVITSWFALGVLQFVAILIMYRDGSRFWLAVTGLVTSGHVITTFLMLLG